MFSARYVHLHHRLFRHIRSVSFGSPTNIVKNMYHIYAPSSKLQHLIGLQPQQYPSNLLQHNGANGPRLSVERWCSGSSEEDVVCYSELRKLTKCGKTVLIDVRNKDETWRTGTIPGSICIPLPELESALNMTDESFQKAYCKGKPTTEDHVIFVCRKGERSFRAMKKARSMGFQKSKTYQGGFMDWFNNERIKRDKKPTSTT